MTERIAIIGSRSYPNARDVYEYVMRLPRGADIVIVSGGARGVDTWAVEAAKECGFAVDEHPPKKWPGQTRGEYARECFARNVRIAEACDRLVAFRAEGKSNGTDHAIGCAQRRGKDVNIIHAKPVPA